MARRDIYEEAYRTIVRRLVEFREQADVTQVELAKRMGTDQSQLSKFERFERRLDIMDYVRYCVSLGVDPSVPLKHVSRSRLHRKVR